MKTIVFLGKIKIKSTHLGGQNLLENGPKWLEIGADIRNVETIVTRQKSLQNNRLPGLKGVLV